VSRSALLAVLVASAAPGLLFTPVFGLVALILPLVLVVATAFLVAEAARRWPGLTPWRALLALLAGLLALTEALLFPTTMGGLPTGDTVRALAAGLTDSWQLTLQSTWPARPDAELLLFVPLAVLAAAVLGVELLARSRWPLVALLPGLAVLGLSQAYVALTGLTAMLAAFGFAVVAAVLLAAADGDIGRTATQAGGRRRFVAVVLVIPTLVLSVAGAVLGAAVDPAERPAFSLRDKQFVPLPPERVTSPLNDLANRMLHGTEEVFRYSTAAPVDRWRLVVLDEFDGVTWTPSTQPRRLGTVLPAPPVNEPTEYRAHVEFPDVDGPWLPSQPQLASVTGLAPLVDETSGTLIAPGRTGPASYDVSWWEPTVSAADLGAAAVDPVARTGFGGIGSVPPDIVALAKKAVGEDRPAFQTALVLERWMRDNYRLATGDELPSGSGWPQLVTFLTDTKRGTTEQFAAAYVVLARIIGIPARIAVGFRADGAGEDVVVHNEDVLAWPEVAVEGIGWVALDPAGAPSGSGVEAKGLAEVTAKARENLPEPDDVRDPELPREDENADESGADAGFSVPFVPIGITVGTLAVLWLAGVPLTRTVRAWLRRRRPGAHSVVGAWAEARDRLRAHGVPYTPGMTVRDMAAAARPAGQAVVVGLHQLAGSVDMAMWSKHGPGPATADEAWSAVRAVRGGLSKRPWRARLRAALDVRSLLKP
jgi:transglutaminase-like putative cysteine protease